MKSHTSGALLTAAFCIVVTTSALAMDPVCNQATAAMRALNTIPVHIYLTETMTYTNPTLAKAAGQIGAGGTKQSEEISTVKDVYVLLDGNWTDMQLSFAGMAQDQDADPDAKQTLEKTRCKALPDETVFGQSASVFLQSIPDLGVDTKIWISKSTNLPLRTDMTNDQGVAKMFTVSRYEYGNVQAPAHATTMKNRVQPGGGH